MKQAITLKGKWFLPESSETFSGTLTCSSTDGCYLEIIGRFPQPHIIPKERKDIILGISIDSKDVTLVNCLEISHSFSSNSVEITKYYAHFALIGHHWLTEQSILFSSIVTEIADFESWVGIYGFEPFDLDWAEHTIGIKFKKPESIQFGLNDSYAASIKFHYLLSTSSHKTENIDLRQTTVLAIDSAVPVSHKELLKQLFTFYKFLTLAYYDAPPIIAISLIDPTLTYKTFNIPKKIEIYYSDHYLGESYKEKKFFEFLFTFPQIAASFPSIIQNWYRLFEKIEPAVNLLTELFVKKNLTLEIRFLSAIQAVESFHRNNYGGSDLPEAAHLERVNDIMATAPEKYKEWLKRQFEFSNELSLKKRLIDFFDRIPEEITTKLIQDKKKFINGVVASRNYFTHYNPNLKKRVLSYKYLDTAVAKLKAILLCGLLVELQFSKGDIVKFVQIHKIYPYID